MITSMEDVLNWLRNAINDLPVYSELVLYTLVSCSTHMSVVRGDETIYTHPPQYTLDCACMLKSTSGFMEDKHSTSSSRYVVKCLTGKLCTTRYYQIWRFVMHLYMYASSHSWPSFIQVRFKFMTWSWLIARVSHILQPLPVGRK